MTLHTWHADTDVVRLELARFGAVVEPRNPAAGVNRLRADEQSLAGCRVLQIELPGSVTPPADFDYYVRGADLVATYPESEQRPLRAQFYWRSRSSPGDQTLAAIELLAAVQTSLLDSCPTMFTRSELLASEALRLMDVESGKFFSILPTPDRSELEELPGMPQCYLFRLPGGRYSYAEMAHPSDSPSSDWQGWLADGDFRLQLTHELFVERLEKGVILKARVLGVLLDRKDDYHTAARHYRDFLGAELPLTT